MKKKIIICILILYQIFLPNIVQATEINTDEIIEEQKQNFGISEFLAETKKYGGELLDDIDISDMLNNAITGKIDNNTIYKKILKILGNEISSSITTLISILIIVVIHSILKTISDNLQNDNISKIIYYAQYVLIVTIIMSNFADIIKMIRETASNLVRFHELINTNINYTYDIYRKYCNRWINRTNNIIHYKFYSKYHSININTISINNSNIINSI